MKRAWSYVFLFLFLTSNACAADLQLLHNNRFEEGFFQGVASSWRDNSGWADVQVEYSPEKTGAHDGLSQRIDVRKFGSGAVQFIHGGVPIKKGSIYEIKIWLRAKLSAPVEILLRKAGDPYTTYCSKTFKVNDTWREYVFNAVSNVDDANALFMIRITSTGTLWADDASLKAVSENISNASRKLGNLIANGSFEVGWDRWGLQINESGSNRYEMSIELLNQKPIVDNTNAKIGMSSLKIVLPEYSRAILTSPYVIVNPGRRYSASLWLAADKPRHVRIGMESGYLGASSGYYNDVEVGRIWKRYSVSAVLAPASENAYHFLLESEGEGQIWVDGVQLEEGDVTPFRARSSVEIGFVRHNPTSFFYEIADQATFTALLSSYESTGAYFVSIKSVDYYGKATVLWSGNVSIVPNTQQELAFKHPTDHPGYFRIVAEIMKDGHPIDSAEMAIGVVRKSSLGLFADSPFGNHARFNQEGLGKAKKMGVSWLRMHPPSGTKWDVVEKNKGEFVFFDEPIMLVKSLGLHILGSLDAPPKWASTAPPDEADFYSRYPPRDIEEWKKYVYATVSHYKGIIDYWEVWNEPDGGLKLPSGLFEKYRKPKIYTQLLKAAYEAAKAANPQAVIVGGVGTGQPPAQWVDAIFSEGAYNYMDILSFHYYTDGRPGDALDVPTGSNVGQMRALMRKYGKGTKKPIWETESGIMYPETSYQNILQIWPGYRGAAQDAPAYVVRNYVHLIASGVSKWFYYDMFSANRIDRTDATGLFEWDGSPRPAALAYANLAWIIGNAKYHRTLRLDSAVSAEEFRDADRVIDIAWAKEWNGDKQVATTIAAAEQFAKCTVYDIMGNVLNKTENIKNINVVVGREPVYIVFTK